MVHEDFNDWLWALTKPRKQKHNNGEARASQKPHDMYTYIYSVSFFHFYIAYNNKILFSTAKISVKKRGCHEATTHWYKLDS